MNREKVSTQQKALDINLNNQKYGTFAEIGAGQEVVRWLFHVGGASGSIAKSISAYDMTISDSIYGVSERYVCRPRLQTMLDYEYSLLIGRLDQKRGAATHFFVFADTVAARNYRGTNECHGWMGIKFQTEPRQDPSQIIIHVRMLDRDNASQQEALGIVGINLVHAALLTADDPEIVLEALLDDLTTDRIEVDLIQFSGPAFQGVDHRLISLKLVQLGLSNATMFSAAGEVLQPSEVLYKKPILVERGSFRPVTYVNIDMLECARDHFIREPAVGGETAVVLMEITMSNLLSSGAIDYADFLARADILAATGAVVMISNYSEYFRLAAYLSTYSKKMIGLAMGIPTLQELFNEKYYENLEGGILESFGRLFKNDLKLYIYPLKDSTTGQLTTVEKLKVAPNLRNLYTHLVDNGLIESLDFYNKNYLHIFSRDVLGKIKEGDSAWETMVPPEVACIIKERGFFNYRA